MPEPQTEKRESPEGGACIVVGHWNPAILQPHWLKQNDIIAEDTVVIQVALALGIGAHVFQFKAAGCLWKCSPDRLELHTDDLSVDPGEKVAKVLKLLEHTPTKAIGNNFYFSDLRIHAEEFVATAGRGRLGPLGFNVKNSSVTLLVKNKETDAAITLAISFLETELARADLNFHREAPKAKLAAEIAGLWRNDLAVAKSIVNAIGGQNP